VSDRQLIEIAAAVADGTPVDWAAAYAGAVTDGERELLRELEFIAGLAGPTSSLADGATPAHLVNHTVESVPAEWGPLRVLELVGRGAFGDVYRAWDPGLDRQVALKILRYQSSDPRSHSTSIEEGRLLARVRHPNIVTVHGAERVGDEVGVWMEFVDGRTLEEELRADGPMSASAAIDVGLAVTSAAAALQDAGILHCDLKAHNVMRDRDGRVLVTDFGAGHDMGAGRLPQAGTPVCAAPEVISGGTASAQSEVYSIGVLLYHLVSGSYPVVGRSLEEVREAHHQGRRTPIAQRRPDLPAALGAVIDRATDPDPRRRYVNAEAMHAALLACRKVSARRATGRLAIIGGVLIAVSAALVANDVAYSPATQAHPLTEGVYLKGRALLYNHDIANARRATGLFEQIIARDPSFAPAFAGLADAWVTMSTNYSGLPATEALNHIRAAASRALELDPTLPEAHAAMAQALAREYRWSAAEDELGRALELNPHLASARTTLAVWVLFPQGKIDEALRQLEAAGADDPFSTDIPGLTAWILVAAGRYDEALVLCRRVMSADPANVHAEQVMARAWFQEGRHDDAITVFRKQGPGSEGFLGYALARTGHVDEARRLETANLDHPAREALIAAGLDDRDAAFAALRAMAARKEPRAQYLTFPELRGLRDDARFVAIQSAFGLSQHHPS
jgi:tetratricopeptide (TPR) repeat protein